MRSSEIAALAGVTVRTLRHYHQVGVLDEPARSANGYRDYDVRDLVRIVRITRLTGLGVPQADLSRVLEDPDATRVLLDELDRDATAEIERLTARRALIAELRHDGVADMPPSLASYPGALAAAGVDPDLARFELEHLTLFTHLAGETGTAALTPVYTRLAELLPATEDVNRRFLALGPDSSDTEVEGVVDDIVALYAPVLTEYVDASDVALPPSGHDLLAEYTGSVLNDRQLHAVELMGKRWGEMVGPT